MTTETEAKVVVRLEGDLVVDIATKMEFATVPELRQILEDHPLLRARLSNVVAEYLEEAVLCNARKAGLGWAPDGNREAFTDKIESATFLVNHLTIMDG